MVCVWSELSIVLATQLKRLRPCSVGWKILFSLRVEPTANTRQSFVWQKKTIYCKEIFLAKSKALPTSEANIDQMEETESGNWVASWGTSVVRVRISRWFGGSLVSRTRPGKVRAPCVALVRSTIKGTRGATSNMFAIKLGTKQHVFVTYKGEGG